MITQDQPRNAPVTLDYSTLESLRKNHPAWRLLCAEHAPLIVSFFHRVFIIPNARVKDQSELVELLEDELFNLHEREGRTLFPRPALDYLNEWTSPEKGWMRKFYVSGSDEPQFDLTPATEKAISWLVNLTERAFVGTESRLLTLFQLLKSMSEGTETDRELRVAELKKRRDELSAQIERAEAGDLDFLDETAVKDRFQQFVSIARELLSDFREVEHNFRNLDRSVREQIALSDGGKGILLEHVMGERDKISKSDQGRSFRAFWDFLMSQQRQVELTALLDRVLALEPVMQLQPDDRLRRVHYDWMEAGDHTQRTVAQLSQQLRRFLDDTARLENKRIMEILRNIEKGAVNVRSFAPDDLAFMEIDLAAADVELPMERPLYSPKQKPRIKDKAVDADDSDIISDALFSQVVVDKDALRRHIRQSLQEKTHVTLQELVSKRPLEEGLAELLAYMELATGSFKSTVDEDAEETVTWSTKEGRVRQARIPRVIFTRMDRVSN